MENRLDPNHRRNLEWMLQVLDLSQLMRRSLPSPGVAPGGSLSSRPAPLATVPYEGHPTADRMMQSGDAAFKEAEVAELELTAYGAVLGLIYYRAIGDTARATWDLKIAQSIDGLRDQMSSILSHGQANWQQARQAGGASPAFLKSYQSLGRAKEVVSQRLDFMVSLQQKKQSVFPSSRFIEFNDDSVVARTPWSQCDAEFHYAAWQMMSGEATTPPVFNRGYDKEAREKTLREEVSNAFNTLLQAKLTDYLDKFLEMGAPLLKGAMRDGFEIIIRHIPVADYFVDYVADFIAERKLANLIDQYRVDEQRRFFLKQLSWGTYTRLSPVAAPSEGVPSGQTGRS